MFVTGLERGLVPISHAKSTEALDEEQRLLYVALSRRRAHAAPQLGVHVDHGQPETRSATRARGSRRVERALAVACGDESPASDVRASIAEARDRATKAGGTRKAARERTPVADADVALRSTRSMAWRLKLSRARERARVRDLQQRHARRHRHRPPGHQAPRCSTSRASGR